MQDKEVLKAFVEFLLKHELWGAMFDNASISGCFNPYYLHSLIMTHDKIKDSFLGKYLRDVFFQHSVRFKESLCGENNSSITMKEFFDGFNKNIKINNFLPNIENIMLNEAAKNHGIELDKNQKIGFFIIEKKTNNQSPTKEVIIKDIKIKNEFNENELNELENKILVLKPEVTPDDEDDLNSFQSCVIL